LILNDFDTIRIIFTAKSKKRSDCPTIPEHTFTNLKVTVIRRQQWQIPITPAQGGIQYNDAKVNPMSQNFY